MTRFVFGALNGLALTEDWIEFTMEQRATYIMAELLASVLMQDHRSGASLLCWEEAALVWIYDQWRRDGKRMNLWTHDYMMKWAEARAE